MGTQKRSDAAVVKRPGRSEAVAVIRSGRARGREVRWRQSFIVGGHRDRGVGDRSEAWLLMGERGGEARNKITINL